MIKIIRRLISGLPLANEPVDTLPDSPLSTLSTENAQSEPDMEVHHHAHIHENKKWKEYGFQFFMLFLAVFCGFIAEYLLEHRIEKEREETYIQSMVEDLKTDTALISEMAEN